MKFISFIIIIIIIIIIIEKPNVPITTIISYCTVCVTTGCVEAYQNCISLPVAPNRYLIAPAV